MTELNLQNKGLRCSSRDVDLNMNCTCITINDITAYQSRFTHYRYIIDKYGPHGNSIHGYKTYGTAK